MLSEDGRMRRQFLSPRNMSILLGLESFQKFGVEEPEIIMLSQRLCGGQKAIKSSALVQTLDLKLGPS